MHASFLTPRGHEPEVLAAHPRESGVFIGWFALLDDDGEPCLAPRAGKGGPTPGQNDTPQLPDAHPGT